VKIRQILCSKGGISLKKRQKQKLLKKQIIFLANDGREFKSAEAKRRWIRDTYDGWGTAYTKYYLKGYPESPFKKFFDY
jgi:hypothetical protein